MEWVWSEESTKTLAGPRTSKAVIHYVAIVEEEREKAVGVWFPDLKGCFSAGDTLDEALLSAREAVRLYAEARDGGTMPPPRPLTQLLVPFEPNAVRPAAE